MSNAAENRKIKENRVYKTLGKMNWQRVVLGVTLLIFIVFLSGVASELLFSQGKYQLADQCMISDRWMEANKPAAKALIEAGSLYANADQDGAYELLKSIDMSESYSMNVNNYSNFCNVLADYYESSNPERAAELRSMADAALESFNSESSDSSSETSEA